MNLSNDIFLKWIIEIHNEMIKNELIYDEFIFYVKKINRILKNFFIRIRVYKSFKKEKIWYVIFFNESNNKKNKLNIW